MVGKNCPEAHCPCMKNSFVTEAAQACMAMYNLNLLTNHNVSEDREEREDRRHGRLPIDHEEGDMVYFEPIGEVANAGSSLVGMGYDDDFMAAIDKLL